MKIESLRDCFDKIDYGTREGEKTPRCVCTSYENNESHEVFIYYSLLGAQGTKEVELLLEHS